LRPVLIIRFQQKCITTDPKRAASFAAAEVRSLFRRSIFKHEFGVGRLGAKDHGSVLLCDEACQSMEADQ